MKKVLLTTPCAPFDLGWGADMLDLLSSRLTRGQDVLGLKSELPTWGLYIIAENIRNPCTVLEYPQWDEFIAELGKGYDVIGIQLKSVNAVRTAKMVAAIRQRSPASEIVIGGYGVSALDEPMPGDTENHADYVRNNADHLCREEGVKFMRRLLGDTPVDRPITQFELPPASITMPWTSKFELKVPAILVSLGCPSACDFCNTSAFFKHKKIYVAEPEQTYEFMKSHLRRLGGEVLNVVLFDEDIFLNPEYVRELGRLIRSDRKTWGMRWIGFGSVRALSGFSGEELRECGVGGIWIGVESGIKDGERSKTGCVKRDGTREPPELFAELHKYGIETIGSMILGFDFHTPENIEQDIDYFVDLKPLFYQVGPLTPCPGTKLYNEMKEAGRILPHYTGADFHLWKDDVFLLRNFARGGIKPYYDLAHEKLRTVNGPPMLQFCECNISAYQTMKGSKSEFLRFQAESARTLAQGALPLVRVTERHAPSPRVKERARDITARAERVLGRPSLAMRAFGAALEGIGEWRATHSDPLDHAPVVSDPGVRTKRYNQPRRRDLLQRLAQALRTRTERSLPPASKVRVRVAEEPLASEVADVPAHDLVRARSRPARARAVVAKRA